MYSKMTKFIYILLLGIATITAAQAEDFLALDEAIPKNSNTAKYAPLFDFDTNGCLPSAGISRDGQMNQGLETTGAINGACYGVDPEHFFLPTSNTLHRYACITSGGSTYCGHFYSLYFEKDQTLGLIHGHRHDWEMVAVWTTDGVITHVCASAHGDCDPVAANSSSVLFDEETGDHVMIVFHLDGNWDWSTHAFRFANSDDVADPENPHGSFVTPTLTSWYELTGDGISNPRMRAWLNCFDYGTATIPMKDSTFLNNLNKYKPSSYPVFQVNPDPSMREDCYATDRFSEENGGVGICAPDYVVTGILCSGDFCDDKQLMCCKIPGLTLEGPLIDTPYFSEHQPNYYMSDAHAVVGMQCRGSNCDDISLILRSAVGTGGEWTETFSDPVNGECGSGYVAGVACYGSWCDDLSLYCKEIGHPSVPAIYPLLLLDTK